jgi:hypothetical protein
MWRKTMLTRNLPEPPEFFFFEKWRRTRFIEHAVIVLVQRRYVKFELPLSSAYVR